MIHSEAVFPLRLPSLVACVGTGYAQSRIRPASSPPAIKRAGMAARWPAPVRAGHSLSHDPAECRQSATDQGIVGDGDLGEPPLETPGRSGSLHRTRQLARRESHEVKKMKPLPPSASPPATLKRSPRRAAPLRDTIIMVQASFVNRNTLGVFCDMGVTYFKDHWSSQLVDGAHSSTAVESILKAVPGLSSLLTDVRKKMDLGFAVRAISYVPEGTSASYTNACIVHLGGEYARITKPNRTGSVSDAIVFHLANDDGAAAAAA